VGVSSASNPDAIAEYEHVVWRPVRVEYRDAASGVDEGIVCSCDSWMVMI